MTEKIYYIQNSVALDEAIERLINLIPCFVDRDFIEMDYSKVVVKANNADLATVEKILAPLV